MSLLDYQPGQLSLLLNPTAPPDVYKRPPPAKPQPASVKRSLDNSHHQPPPSKKRKTNSSLTPSHPNAVFHPKGYHAPVNVDDSSDEEEEEEVKGGDEEAEVDDDGAVDGEEEDLSDLDDLDPPSLDATGDEEAVAARQSKREKRLREDEEAELLSSSAPKRRLPTHSPAADPRLPRTLFIGNVSVDCTRKALERRFKEYGTIESCRFRSFSVNNPKLPKKVAMVRHAFHPQRQTMNAYVVYEEEEAVTRALQANGTQFMDLTLRCDYADSNKRQLSTASSSTSSSPPALSHPRQTLFIGNLPFATSEEALLSLFAVAGQIRYVRLVRDPQMNVGKGFGFVVFEEEAAVKKALAMAGVTLDGRVLRLSRGLDEDKLKQMRETKEKERLREEGMTGAARRMAGKEKKEKHSKRKAEAAKAQGLPPPAKGRPSSASSKVASVPSKRATSYGGERSDPQEWVRKQRRLEKKKKQKKEERKQKHSLVRTKHKKPRQDSASARKSAS